MFLPCSLLIQDGFSEDEWKEAEEAVATVQVRRVYLTFDDKSSQTSRAVQTITDGLAWNKFIGRIMLQSVPKGMQTAVKHKLCNFRLDIV